MMGICWEMRQVDISAIKNMNEKEELFRMIDRGIDDMKEGRELPLEEAFKELDKLVETRKIARA